MSAFRTTAALALSAFVLGGSVSYAQVAYIPPGTQGPRFGGEFNLSEVGPVAGYWPTMCRTLRLRAQQNQSGPLATPDVSATFDRFVSGLIAKKPNYDDMTPAMADTVRKHIGTYWASFNRMGRASAAKKIGADNAGNDEYVLDQEGGRTHWGIIVTSKGKIDQAIMCAGQGV